MFVAYTITTICFYRILLFGFDPTQMIVTKTFEVKLTNVDHFYFLPVRSIQQNTYQKYVILTLKNNFKTKLINDII